MTMTPVSTTPPGWQRNCPDGINRLVRRFRFADYAAALAFVNRVAAAADAADHHPAMLLEWGSVEVSWWSHDAGGVTERDLRLAAQTDALASG